MTVHLRHLTGGRSTSLQEAVRVFASGVLERELQPCWSTLKDALHRRDLPAALECFTVSRRAQVESAFRLLFVDRTTNVDDVLAAIRLVRQGRGYALYEAIRTDSGLAKSFDVRFAIGGVLAHGDMADLPRLHVALDARVTTLGEREEVVETWRAALDARHPPLVHGDEPRRVADLDEEDRGEIAA